VECDWTTEVLGSTAPWQRSGVPSLPGDHPAREREGALVSEDQRRLAAHLEECSDCAAYAGELDRLDAILLSEPVPPPPPDLSAWILREVAARRRAELAWARGRSLLVAAALILAAGLALVSGVGEVVSPEAWSSGDWDLSLRARDQLQGGLSQLRSSFDGFVQAATPSGDASETGLWGPLLALAPVLLLLNWAVGRGALHPRVSS